MTSEKGRKHLPPYVSYRTFYNFIERLQQHMPSRIDRSYWGELLSGSNGTQLMAALRFLSNELKDKVCIEQTLPEHQTVRANRNKLIHLMVNLLQNSLDALQAKSFNGEQPTIWIEGRVENGACFLVVRDNGIGIENQHLDKIFDPFFTTKDVGQGMGLGLSICYRIMQESHGKISVRTERGKFCEFTLEFPAKG